jgi:peptidoglycan/xylan/chitin deacetylase (PgdA/CDA1 family)
MNAISEPPAKRQRRKPANSNAQAQARLLGRVQAASRRLGWAALGAVAQPPKEKDWIQVQFYHWVLEEQRPIFRRQLQSLRRYGDFISLDDAVDVLRSGQTIGGRYFCVTFDDGFKECLTGAAPVLADLGIPAAFFIPTKYIGLDAERDWDQIKPFYQRSWSEYAGAFDFLDWSEVRQLADAGFRIGSHTHSHPRLAEVTPGEAENEMRLAKSIIEDRLGAKCRHFCCPWGKVGRDFDPDLHPDLARKVGYDSFLTTEEGLNLSGHSPFYLRRVGCEPDHNPAMMKYALFAPWSGVRGGSRPGETGRRAKRSERSKIGTITSAEGELVRLRKFPYPFQSAVTVASDIDSASVARFRAIHALLGREAVIRPGSAEWETLGLNTESPGFDSDAGGVRGLGLELADSFFLVGDRTTFGMYREASPGAEFSEDQQDATDCRRFIEEEIKLGEIDAFHAFLHFKRRQIEPLLRGFYSWCERENVAKPGVWLNHSLAVTPSGLCPDRLQPNRFYRLARLSARSAVGPLLGRKRLPLKYALARYCGDSPSSPYYINDLLAANGLRFVWLNMDDLQCNRIALAERVLNQRETILEPVTMDDGIRYYRFNRCYGKPLGRLGGESYLRDSIDGFDGSSLITEQNLAALCRSEGTCILYTHWAHSRSFPLSPETIERFALLRRWRDQGKVWVTPTGRLLEWTRLRTFLRVSTHRQGGIVTVDIEAVEDPIFGIEPVTWSRLEGLCFEADGEPKEIRVCVAGVPLPPGQVRRAGNLCWLQGGKG